jgi:hypothetical protein
MLVNNGKTALRRVDVGLMNDDLAEITQGLAADETVVARPSREITANLRVAINPAE